jgi:GGDEF domain-containing protein
LTRWTATEGKVLDAEAFGAATNRALAHEENRAVVLIRLTGAPEAVIAAAEARIVRTIRPSDLLGRLGHDRFAVLTAQGGGRAGAERVAARLAHRLIEPFHVGGESVRLMPRIGVGFGEGSSDNAVKLLLRAEQDFDGPS